jgi:hypothetical protein
VIGGRGTEAFESPALLRPDGERASGIRAGSALPIVIMGGTLALWRCPCGETLWEECRFNGLDYCPVFHSHPKELGRGRGLIRCPGCGEPLYPARVRDAYLRKAATRTRAGVGRYLSRPGERRPLPPHTLPDSGIDQ